MPALLLLPRLAPFLSPATVVCCVCWGGGRCGGLQLLEHCDELLQDGVEGLLGLKGADGGGGPRVGGFADACSFLPIVANLLWVFCRGHCRGWG